MNAGSELKERIVNRGSERRRMRYVRIAVLYTVGVLLSVGLPFVFGSWTLSVALVVLLVLGGVILLALAIYEGARR